MNSLQVQARALGDPTRHEIFRYLIDAGDEVDVAELTNHVGLNHNAVRQHLTKLVDAGLVELVDTDQRIDPAVRLLPSPGHTPGHVSVLIESQGESALISGDFLHHPCQIAHPEWHSTPDADVTRAIQTRQAMLTRFADTPTLIIGTHFASPTAGRLVRDGDRLRFAT